MKDSQERHYDGRYIYAGCGKHVVIAVSVPLLIIILLGFSLWVVQYGKTNGILYIHLASLYIAGLLVFYLIKAWDKLYCWCAFDANEVILRMPFRRPFALQYIDLTHVGIRVFVYKDVYDPKSERDYWIFLSEYKISRKYARNINRMPNCQWSVRVPFSHPLYRYLVEVLPAEPANLLRLSYLKKLKYPNMNQYVIEVKGNEPYHHIK